jgi:hypothetical protein
LARARAWKAPSHSASHARWPSAEGPITLSPRALIYLPRAAHAQPKLKHHLAHAVELLRPWLQPLADDVQRRLVGDQQGAPKKVRLAFNPAIVDPFPIFRQGRRTLVPQKSNG